MTFRGWSAEAIEFFDGLTADNSRAFWQANRDVYLHAVRAPMEALLEELAPEFGTGTVFRPYRDVRFSRDKSPYKTAIGASMTGGGYFQLSSRGLAAGSGLYMPAPDQLERYRRAVAEARSGRELERIVAEVRAAGVEISAHEVLKTAPRGYPKDHPRIELLRNKGLIAWREWPVGAWLGTRKAKDRVVELPRTAVPLRAWLDRHVGPSESPEG